MPAAPLSVDLRARTAAAHAGAERSPFLVALLEGRGDRVGAAALLGRLAVVARVLEQTARGWADDPVVGPFLLPVPARAARLAADLRLLGAREVASPAVTAYAERLQGAAAQRRAAYLAHHHVRHLGDLSGGQLVGAALRRALGLPLTALTDAQPAEARRRSRALLDAVPLGPDEREELVAEALLAYRLNVALVGELDG